MQKTVQVRLEGPTEEIVRKAAEEMGVQVSTVKPRGDTVHLYGSVIINTD